MIRHLRILLLAIAVLLIGVLWADELPPTPASASAVESADVPTAIRRMTDSPATNIICRSIRGGKTNV